MMEEIVLIRPSGGPKDDDRRAEFVKLLNTIFEIDEINVKQLRAKRLKLIEEAATPSRISKLPTIVMSLSSEGYTELSYEELCELEQRFHPPPQRISFLSPTSFFLLASKDLLICLERIWRTSMRGLAKRKGSLRRASSSPLRTTPLAIPRRSQIAMASTLWCFLLLHHAFYLLWSHTHHFFFNLQERNEARAKLCKLFNKSLEEMSEALKSTEDLTTLKPILRPRNKTVSEDSSTITVIPFFWQ